jgi:hypothetical protein
MMYLQKIIPETNSSSFFFSTLLFFLSVTYAVGQTQIGADIDGLAKSDNFGFSVSMPDRYTVAVGAIRNDDGGNNTGKVQVFTWNGTSWVQKGSDINGSDPGEYLGWSVSMPDANTLAVSAPEYSSSYGRVFVYEWNGTDWVQKGPTIIGSGNDTDIGYSIWMPHKNTLAIGIPDNGPSFEEGMVRVYNWDGTAWNQKGADLIGTAPQEIGYSVCMPDTNTIALGGIGDTTNGPATGVVKIYSWIGNSWVQKGDSIVGESALNSSGWTISMPDTNTIAVGAPFNSDSGNISGHVRIYTWNGTNWIQKGADLDGTAADDWFGHSVSMPDSNTVAIGARQERGSAGLKAGYVRIFRWDGAAWNQWGNDIIGDSAEFLSGYAVAMVEAGIVAIGSPGSRFASKLPFEGKVKVFTLCNTVYDTIADSTCIEYLSPSGRYTWDTSGVYLDTIPNSIGCDSILTINLVIQQIDTSVANLGATLTATASSPGTTYQWLDCNNAFTPITGATNQSYTPTITGDYAVEINQNGCTDTSFCHEVIIVGNTHPISSAIAIYPNPTDGRVIIDLGEPRKNVRILVYDISGKMIREEKPGTMKRSEVLLTNKPGVYLVEVFSDDVLLSTSKVVVE